MEIGSYFLDDDCNKNIPKVIQERFPSPEGIVGLELRPFNIISGNPIECNVALCLYIIPIRNSKNANPNDCGFIKFSEESLRKEFIEKMAFNITFAGLQCRKSFTRVKYQDI